VAHNRNFSYHTESLESAKEAHILVIRLSAMGDVAMVVPVLTQLTNRYPNVKITVLTRAFFRPMFANLRNVRVFEADVKGKHKGVFGLWKLYQELNALDIDGVADLHNVLRSNILKQYFKFGKIPFAQIDKGRKEKKALTSPQKDIFKPLRSTHYRYCDVFSHFGISIDMREIVYLPKQPLSQKTQQLVGEGTQKWLGIAPYAAFPGKMYPLDLMEQVIAQLNLSENFKIFFFGGGPDQRAQFDTWESKFKNSTNVAGIFSFEEELALISNLDLMLSMDSGNAHLAAMYGIPTLTLWGVTHPYAGFAPVGQDESNTLISDRDKFPLIPTSVYGNKLPEGYERCMATIAPETVIEKINAMLLKTV
tara:strand:+ start:170979 stop:172070 length:1092 start_codon:yes stop_codon:yes gene_type:complete